MTTASVLPAVKQAAENAVKNLVRAALANEQSPLHDKKADAVTAADGYVFLKGSAPESGVAYSQVLAANNQAAVEGEGYVAPGAERERT